MCKKQILPKDICCLLGGQVKNLRYSVCHFSVVFIICFRADTEAWQSQHTVRGIIFLCLERSVYHHLHNKILTQITDGEETLMLPHVGSMIQFLDETISLTFAYKYIPAIKPWGLVSW